MAKSLAPHLSYANMFSIDPGLSGTGWATWNGRTLLRVGVTYAPGDVADTVGKAEALTEKLIQEMRPSHSAFAHTYIEMPQHMTSIKGIAAQAGSVYKLAFFVGYLAHALNGTRVHLVTPMEWKGQLPKDVVQRRIIRDLGVNTCTRLNIRSHAWDAVGLGMWANGKVRR